MSIPLNIQGQAISFPSDQASPDWAAAIIAFAQAATAALQGAVGTYDVAPQIFTMSANSNTNVSITDLTFPTAAVRGAIVNYYIYRTTTTNNEAEYGTLQLIYNPNNSVGQLWEMSREGVGTTTVTFSVTDTGQVQFTSPSIAGSNHIGIIGFSAKSLQQTY